MASAVNMFQGFKNVARKTARVNPDLIDVDLVRGDSFVHSCIIELCLDVSPSVAIEILPQTRNMLSMHLLHCFATLLRPMFHAFQRVSVTELFWSVKFVESFRHT